MTSTSSDNQTPDVIMATHAQRGWHMAGIGVITSKDRRHQQVTLTGPEGSRTFGRYDMVEVTRPAPVMWSAEWPYPEFTPAEFAAHYQRAAEIIEHSGYYPYEIQGSADEPGISIVTALKTAAFDRAQAAAPDATVAHLKIDAANVTEELETRLSAVIYTLGLLHSRTGISDFSDQLAAWELGHYTTGPVPTKAEALGLLAMAAGIYAHISDTQAEVTAPPAPGLASCGHPANADGEHDCASWPERAPNL